jgi:multidrug efflux pump subunit AcrB
MRLVKSAIENHQFTIVFVVLLMTVGLYSFLTMPRSEDPQVTPAGSSVIVVLPGATPADIEELIIDPVEEVINELEDIKHIDSRAEDGLGVVEVEFLIGSDPDDKYSEVVQKVNSIRNTLPEEMLSLDIVRWSISDVNILQLALYSDDASYAALEKEAERLKKSLEKVAGVHKIRTWAFPEQEIRIAVDLDALAQYQLSLPRVIQAIQGSNQTIPAGRLDIGSRRFNIQTNTTFKSLADIENTILQSAAGKLFYLKDVARVSFTYEDQRYYALYQDHKAVLLTVSQKEGTNIFAVMKGLQQRIQSFSAELPADIKITSIFDQSASVANRLNGFFLNLLQGLILVGAVIFISMGIRESLIVMSIIPVSVLMAIGAIDFSNFGLQQMTISGLVIALGMLVDNAIVVTENISRHMREGYQPQEAAVRATGQIAWAVTSSTLTTVFAFIPMLAMGDMTGDFIRSMPLTVVYALIASLLVSVTFTPFLASKYLRPTYAEQDTWFKKRLDDFIVTRYRKAIDYALNHPRQILISAVAAFIISLALFPLLGVSFFPKAEKPQFIININTPEGTTIDQTEKIARQVEGQLQRYKDIKYYIINIGHGNPRIYYNVIPENNKSNHAQLFIQMDEYNAERFDLLISDLRAAYQDIPGAKIEVKEFEQGPPIEAPVAVRIIGENMDVLKKLAAETQSIIAATAGTVNLNNPLGTSKTDLQVRINKDKAGMLGIPLYEIDQLIRSAVTGSAISKFRDEEGKEYNITIRLPDQNKIGLRDFNKIFIPSYTGQLIPLRQLAVIEFKSSPLAINHHDLERTVTITADVQGEYSVNSVTLQIIEQLNKYPWPKGYRFTIGGEMESRQESFGGMFQATLIAALAIFGLLVLQFRSYKQPFIVFSAIPLAVIGSILTLLITGYSFSFTAFIGLTSLFGIVVNNSILLVDYTNQLRQAGMEVITALKKAGETRFLPIFLTTTTTIGGLLPLTIAGGTLWAPLGWTIIGGLTVSTILTLIIVPVLYKLYSK